MQDFYKDGHAFYKLSHEVKKLAKHSIEMIYACAQLRIF
jgi:hypothetical protein